MVSDSISPQTFSGEFQPRSCLCTYAFHRRDFKDPDIHALDGEFRQQKNTQHAPSTKTECDYRYGWMKKKKTKLVRYTKISLEMVNPRDIAGNAEEEEEEEKEE